jgi:serine/threonine protein phosphatase PrpC
MSEFSFHIQSNVGGRTENEDCYISKQTPLGLLIIVCDGMGGTEGGKLAATMACQMVTDHFISLKDKPVQGIVQAIETANKAICEKGQHNRQGNRMGTTLAALLLTKEQATFFHVGDSRIYHLRNGQIEKRTADHSRVGEMVRRGILNDEQARLSADSNIISKALGIEPEVEVEVTTDISFRKGDRFAVCTDGIWGTMPEEKLITTLSNDQPVESITNALVQQINANQFEAGGGHDNMTLALVEIIGNRFAGTNISPSVFLNVLLTVALAISLFYHFKRPVTAENNTVKKDSSAPINRAEQDTTITLKPVNKEPQKSKNAQQQKKPS